MLDYFSVKDNKLTRFTNTQYLRSQAVSNGKSHMQRAKEEFYENLTAVRGKKYLSISTKYV